MINPKFALKLCRIRPNGHIEVFLPQTACDHAGASRLAHYIAGEAGLDMTTHVGEIVVRTDSRSHRVLFILPSFAQLVERFI